MDEWGFYEGMMLMFLAVGRVDVTDRGSMLLIDDVDVTDRGSSSI